jgi:hypothetical protein
MGAGKIKKRFLLVKVEVAAGGQEAWRKVAIGGMELSFFSMIGRRRSAEACFKGQDSVLTQLYR